MKTRRRVRIHSRKGWGTVGSWQDWKSCAKEYLDFGFLIKGFDAQKHPKSNNHCCAPNQSSQLISGSSRLDHSSKTSEHSNWTKMELLEPLTRLRISTPGCSKPLRASLHCQRDLTRSHRLLSCSNRKTLPHISTRYLSTSKTYQREPPNPSRSAQQPSSTPPTQNQTQPSQQSQWDSFRKVAREPAKPSLRSAADDLFGQRQDSSSAALTRGVLDNIKIQSESGMRDITNSIRLRLKPSLGRTKPIDSSRGVDLQTAIGRLEASCKTNGVRFDERSQKIYVRRGQRRKILKSKRWRNLFKEGFIQEVGRIQRMRKQGW